jgi:DNA-binding transcriptional regulator YdaS (Cro superfamily)
MSAILPDSAGARPQITDQFPRPRMAKAVLTDDQKRLDYARVLKRAQQILGKSHKEMADLLGVPGPQLSAWYAGRENAQTWRYHSLEPVAGTTLTMRDAMRLAEAWDARESGGVTVRTVIEMVR